MKNLKIAILGMATMGASSALAQDASSMVTAVTDTTTTNSVALWGVGTAVVALCAIGLIIRMIKRQAS